MTPFKKNMKLELIIFLGVLTFGVFSVLTAPAYANHIVYNCGKYGTAYSDTYLNPGGNRSSLRCPSDKPMTNSLITTSAGSHCCMTRANSDKFISDYNTAHAGSTGSGTTGSATTSTTASASGTTTTTSTRSTTSTSSGSTTTSASPSTQQAAATQYCDAPNTCVNSASGCPSAQPHNVNSVTPCDPVKYPGRICCSATNPTQSGGTGTTGSTSAVSITLSNPLKYDTIEGVLTSIMAGLKGIVVVLALLMIVIGGIMYIFSAGNDGRMKVAKNTILAALIGLAIVIAAPAFLKEISVLLGWDSAPAIEGGTQLTLTEIASNILKFLLSIIGILALIMMFVSGILYMASGGNDARVKQAKAMFVASLIGITVAMGSLVLVSAVARFFIP